MILVANKRMYQVIVFLLIIMLIFATIGANIQPKQAFAQVVILQAFGALVGIVLTALTGYTLAETWDLTVGDLDTLYNNVMSKLSGLDQAQFIAGLTTFATTGQITQSLIDSLQIGVVANEVIDKVQADYTQMTSGFSAETLALMETELDTIISNNTYSYAWGDIKYIGYQNYNDRYLIGIKAGTTTTDGMMTDALDMVGFNVMNDMYNGYPGFLMTFEKVTTAYVSNGAYTYPNRRVGVAMVMMDTWYDDVVYSNTSVCYGTGISPWNIKPYTIIEGSSYINGIYQYAEPCYNFGADYVFDTVTGYLPTVPGITDLDKGTISVPVPTDTDVALPTFPANPTIDDVIGVEIPAVATGEGVMEIPVDEVGTAGEVNPTDPALDMSMPTTTMLDLSPLYSTGLMDKFPFCIPQDILSVFTVFSDTARTAPVMTLPFLQQGNISDQEVNIEIDFSFLDTVAQVGRYFQYLAFLILLIVFTGKILL